MAELHPGQPVEDEPDDPATSSRNARYGLVLFAVYLVLYGGFVLINAFAPEQMDRIVWSGLNLAVLYGFALIVAALLISLVYGWLCREPVRSSADERKEPQA